MTDPILIVDDEADIRDILCDILEDEGYDVVTAAHSEAAFHVIKQTPPLLAILDIWLENSDKDGLEILQTLSQDYPETTVLMISGHGNVETAVKAMQLGAYDFIEKPFKIDHLIRTVERAMQAGRMKRENITLRSRLNVNNPTLTGESAAINALRKQIVGLQGANTRVLVTGVRGTGKSSAAALLLNGQTIITLDCDALRSETLIQAIEEHPQALILDHVQKMSHEVQEAIISLIQKGDNLPRIVSIADAQPDDDFSPYLWGQLAVETITMPNITQRTEDIASLARQFVSDACRHFAVERLEATQQFLQTVTALAWPGQIGQLKLACQWSVETALNKSADKIDANHLPGDSDGQATPSTMLDLPLKQAREVFERDYLLSQYRHSGENITKMAEKVGMDRAALHRKMKSLEIGEAAESPAANDQKATGS